MRIVVVRAGAGLIPTFITRDSSFRGALLREPGTHNPRPLRITQACGYGFRARGQEPAPRNDDLDRSQLMKVGIIWKRASMKTSLHVAAGLLAVLIAPAAGQAPPRPAPGGALAPFSVVVNQGIPAIPARLSGKPGDPKDGERVVTERRLGNCLSCHEIEALRDFHARHDRLHESLVRTAVAQAEFPTIPHVLWQLQALLPPGDK